MSARGILVSMAYAIAVYSLINMATSQSFYAHYFARVERGQSPDIGEIAVGSLLVCGLPSLLVFLLGLKGKLPFTRG